MRTGGDTVKNPETTYLTGFKPFGRMLFRPLMVAALLLGVGLCWHLVGPHPVRAEQAPQYSASDRKSDIASLRTAVKAAEKSRWKLVLAAEAQIKDDLVRELVRWYRLKDGNAPADLSELQAFLEHRPDWPGRGLVIRNMEHGLATHPNNAAVRTWFAKYPPKTALGTMRHAEALIGIGKRDVAKSMLREAWRDGNFPKADSQLLLKRHRKLLTPDDHVFRTDRLVWEGRYGDARRMLPLVSKDYQRLFQARLALRRRQGNVDGLIRQVPPSLKSDPGLMYERIRWRRRKGKDTALDLIRHIGPDQPHAYRWWRERSVLARKALRKGYITDAYRISKNHGLSKGAGFAEGEWMAGWVGLRFLEEPLVALKHFNRLHEGVSFPISKARAAYWIGRAHEALGDTTQAQQWYGQAAQFPTTYYGQIAHGAITQGQPLTLPPMPGADRGLAAEFRSHPLVKAVTWLSDAGLADKTRPFVTRLLHLKKENAAWAKLTADLAAATGRPDLGIHAAKVADRLGQPIVANAFPRLTPPRLKEAWKLAAVETPLVLGVIRQESAFRQDAISRAKARGLMQIIPPTAKRVAKKLKLPYSSKRLLTDPAYNMTLGQAYLSGLIDKFDGSYILALASYNAGPSRAHAWMRENGDPREPNVDAIDWIEMIPFTETRNYVQRVMENMHVYRAKLATTEVAFAPVTDLNR